MPITAQGSGDIERKSPAVMSREMIISFYFYFGCVSFCVSFFFPPLFSRACTRGVKAGSL